MDVTRPSKSLVMFMPAMSLLLKKIAPVAIGAGLGYLYWHVFGCANGCVITGHWYTSTGYGALVGAVSLLPATKKSSLPPSRHTDASVSEPVDGPGRP